MSKEFAKGDYVIPILTKQLEGIGWGRDSIIWPIRIANDSEEQVYRIEYTRIISHSQTIPASANFPSRWMDDNFIKVDRKAAEVLYGKS